MKKESVRDLFLTSIITVIGVLIVSLLRNYFPIAEKLVLFKDLKESFWGLPTEIMLTWNRPQIFDMPIFFSISLLVIKLWQHLNKPRNRSEQFFVGIILGVVLGVFLGILFIATNGLSDLLKLSFLAILLISCLISFVAGLENLGSGFKFSLALSMTTGLIISLIVGALKTGFLVALIGGCVLFFGMFMVLMAFASVKSFFSYLFSDDFREIIGSALSFRIKKIIKI